MKLNQIRGDVSLFAPRSSVPPSSLVRVLKKRMPVQVEVGRADWTGVFYDNDHPTIIQNFT
jgi:hypothetical protein